MFKSLKLYKNASVDPQELAEALLAFGYRRQENVQEEGDFACRGGILDIFAFTFELPVRIEFKMHEIISINTFAPSEGTSLWAHEMVIVLPVKKTRTPTGTGFSEEVPVDNFLDLKTGDYVVHTQHGIGRYLGLEKVNIKEKRQDFLVLQYERQEKLYVPVEQMNLVQKYVSFLGKKPKLYRLGSKEWLRTKEKTRRGIQRFAWELLSLQAMRLSAKRAPYAADTDWQKQFEATFPFRETPDQAKTTQEVKNDMESGRLMDRLVCGDVGYGKTEVAMRAAFKAIMGNKQVAYLVPTTILAQQHYRNFKLRLGDFPINIAMLSRFKTETEQKGIIKRLSDGSTDMVIGTHRLLSEDIKFKNLGLLIIDEEQRFGVKAKEKLKTFKFNIDVLVLTATPIPRTLYMSMMALKDLSLINTAPQERLPIKTIVIEYDDDLVAQAILREVKRKGQVYFVHNRIQDIQRIKERLASHLPKSVRVAVAHGQMPANLLEMIMEDFLRGEIDVLVSTMIIESGIDIPNVNTIIIDQAHTFGLSDLHQLRGRVGRFNRAAYAYFLVPGRKVMDSDAQKRLSAIQEFSFLGAGFKIAMEDLQIRGAGNLLGAQQHGYIAAVGFDLYCRLLRETVDNLRRTPNYEK